MSPNGSGFDVALDALRSDARKWDAAAQDLSKPLGNLDSLNVSVADVSIFAEELGNSFNEANSAMQDTLKKAIDYFQKLSSDLNESASEYQSDDEKGLHEVQNSYRMQGDLYGG